MIQEYNIDTKPQEAIKTINKLISLCDLHIESGKKEMEVKVDRPYTGGKTMRVMGDLHGTPVSYLGNQTMVSVNCKKFKNKLRSGLVEAEKELNKWKKGISL